MRFLLFLHWLLLLCRVVPIEAYLSRQRGHLYLLGVTRLDYTYSKSNKQEDVLYTVPLKYLPKFQDCVWQQRPLTQEKGHL